VLALCTASLFWGTFHSGSLTSGQAATASERPQESPAAARQEAAAPAPARPAEKRDEAAVGGDFDREIAPLLARRCLECHNTAEKRGGLDLTGEPAARKGGDSGPALPAKRGAESLLGERVAAGEMPPKGGLPEAERQLIARWVASGAVWGTTPIDRFQFSSESRAGYDFWSLQPVRRPTPPPAPPGSVVQNPIDQFIAATRAERGLQGSPRADQRTLVRRAWQVLLGLPAPEVAWRRADAAPKAWNDVVEELLARPEYGERWGRHWLDLVRFGESQGFERDKLRTTSWNYRDWVVWALNSDLPYDEFVRWQVAGDVLRPDDPRAVIATGFLVAAPWDEVGQSQQSQVMRRVVRQDELEDVIGTVAQSFLGLTVNCARCHDHKFDPVSQVEYYRLAAALAGVRHGERDARSAAAATVDGPRLAQLEAEITRQREALVAWERPFREAIVARRQERVDPEPAPVPLARWEFNDDLRDAEGELHGTAQGTAKLVGGRLVLDGSEGCQVITAPLATDLGAKTLAVWVALDNLSQQGGAAMSVQSPSGAIFDAIVFGEREAGQWMAGSNGFVRSRSFQAPVETATPDALVQLTLVYGADRTITAYRNGRPYGTPYQADSLATFEKGGAQVLFGLRHSPPGGNRQLRGAIDRALLFSRALTPAEVARLAGTFSTEVTSSELWAELNPAQREEYRQRLRGVSLANTELGLWKAGRVYAVSPKPAEPTHLLERGNPEQRGEVLAAGGLRALAPHLPAFELPVDAPEEERRKQLAAWLTSPANPLFARAIVNRLWHHHFGVGLVETPNDLGFNGARPSHPELLDWLAAELVDPQVPAGPGEPAPRPFSLKHLQRLIVQSATWQQSSAGREEALATDAGNRWLWRYPPRRLDAESVRDAMLAVSGELNPAMGGPGFQDFRTFTFNSQFYEMLDPEGPEFQRRTLYRTWVRSGRSEFLDVFDCPDPSTTAPRRAVTTTPLQALALLNNSFTLRMSERLAERARAEVGGDARAQVRRVCELAWGRTPSAEELEPLIQFTTQHGLPALGRVVFNSNEFLYVD
jgi:hypothetical protein